MKSFYKSLLAVAALTMTGMTATAQSDGAYTVEGDYSFNLYSRSDGNTVYKDINVAVTYDSAMGKYLIKEQGTEVLPSDIKFTFDNATNKATFKQDLVDVKTMTNCVPFTYNNWKDLELPESYDIDWNPATGVFEFPADNFGFGWITDESLFSDFPSFSTQYYFIGCTRLTSGQVGGGDEGDDDDAEWKNVGMATFVDGWVLPMLEIDQTKVENQYEVLLQRNKENENLYRLVNPYKSGPAAPYNEHSTKEGYIEFDVTNPDWVLFNKVGAGFAYDHPWEGSKKFRDIYCVNHLRETMDKYGFTDPAKVTGVALYKNNTLASTFADGVVTLAMDTADKLQYGFAMPDARYATPEDPDKTYHYWYDDNDRPVNMTAMIIFPKEESVEPEIPEIPELPEIPEDAVVIYSNGNLLPNLNVENWYNAAINFTADNPTGGDTKVFEFKAGNLTYDWGQAGYASASMGLNMVKPANTGSFHNATLNFHWYAAKAGAKYTVRLTATKEEDYDFIITDDQVGKWNVTSLNIAEKFPTVAKEWEEDTNFGQGYVFSIIISGGTEEDAMYFDGIYYTNVDTEWTAPEHEIPAPETVPVPEQDAANVISVFSDKYMPATGFNIGWWGQSTDAQLQQIDNKDVYYLRNFNYLGWELTKDLDVADYGYLHVDYWTADEGAGFGITPVTREGTAKEKGIEQTVKLNEWNSYDIDLSEYEAVGMDLSTVFQIKFDFGKNKNGYIANVYFWRETPAMVYDIEGNLNAQLDMSFGSGEDLQEAEDYPLSAKYDADARKLYMTPLAYAERPIVFKVNTNTWTIEAEKDQLGMVDDGDPDYVLEYYYGDIATQEYTVYGKIENISDTQSRITLDNWGLGMDFEGSIFFGFAWFNNVITLDYYFEDAPMAEEDKPAIEYDIEGNLNAQLDMSFGSGEDLQEAEDYPLSAKYDAQAGKLYMTPLAQAELPIVFKVNTNTWTIEAEKDQLGMVDDGDPDDVWEYYYGDIATQEYTVYGKIENISETQSRITLDNWGLGMDFYGSVFFGFAWFNNVITLDYYFEGAPMAKDDIEFAFSELTGSNVTEAGDMDCQITVTATNVPEDAKVELYYSLVKEGEYSKATRYEEEETPMAVAGAVSTLHYFTLNGLEAEKDYTLYVYATAGTAKSEIAELTFSAKSGVGNIVVDGDDVIYYNLQGVRVNNPENGVYIRVEGTSVTKVVR